MDTGVELGSSTKLVGLFDITVSKYKDTVFISHNKANSPGLANSIALYATDDGSIKSAGISLMYDRDTETLKTSSVSVEKEIISKRILSENLKCDNIYSDIATVNFLTITEKETGNVVGTINIDDFGNGNILTIATKKETGETGCAIYIDNRQRVTICDGGINFKKKKFISKSIGYPGDQKGDIAVNDYYLYYCTKDYNGVDSIWVRWSVTDRSW